MEIIRLDEANTHKTVAKAVDVLKKGGILLYPTDTLYGLAVDALNKPALERLRLLKGREKKRPISIIVPEVEDISRYAEFTPEARALAAKYLPGPLTLVLPGIKEVPEELMLNGQIGIRVPDSGFGRDVARALGRPITATSANRTGFPSLPSPLAVLEQFGLLAQEVDLVVDAGEIGVCLPSTVVAFAHGAPVVLREGVITRADLGL